MNIVRKLDLTTVAAAGGANSLSTARGQGDADDGQVLATERPPDGLMPPRKKRRGSARQQTALSALVADSAGVGGADTQHRSPSADESEASSQQAAADSVYHEFLRSLTPKQLDFVRKDEQWPGQSSDRAGAMVEVAARNLCGARNRNCREEKRDRCYGAVISHPDSP
jgi:hypothetical protein